MPGWTPLSRRFCPCCLQVRFRPEAALELHRQLYKQKVVSLLTLKGQLSDGDAEDLKRIRRILCIPADVAKKVGARGTEVHVGELRGMCISVPT